MAFAKSLDNLDAIIVEVRKILDNFKIMKEDPEIDEKQLIRYMSKKLASADYIILEIMKELRISTTDFDERRNKPDGF